MDGTYLIGWTGTSWWLTPKRWIWGWFKTGSFCTGDAVMISVRIDTAGKVSNRIMVDDDVKGHLVDKVISV